MCWTPLCTNSVNKTWALLQTTGGKDESNIVIYVNTIFCHPYSTDINAINNHQTGNCLVKGHHVFKAECEIKGTD